MSRQYSKILNYYADLQVILPCRKEIRTAEKTSIPVERQAQCHTGEFVSVSKLDNLFLQVVQEWKT
jgi:hypothetical protein